jgi:hypothetical protein
LTPHVPDIVKGGESADSSGEAGAPEIEVTPAMIEAGARFLADAFDQPIDWLTEERAANLYRAMSTHRAAAP